MINGLTLLFVFGMLGLVIAMDYMEHYIKERRHERRLDKQAKTATYATYIKGAD